MSVLLLYYNHNKIQPDDAAGHRSPEFLTNVKKHPSMKNNRQNIWWYQKDLLTLQKK